MKKKEKVEQTEEVEVNEVQEDKVKKLEEELASWKDKAYRMLADTDNLRKAYEKEHQMMVMYRGQPFVEKLVPTLDSFYLVLKNEPTDPMLKNYLIGFNMIYNSMLNALSEEGVSQVLPSVGVEFDHTCMQAIDTVEGEKDNIVMEVSKPGYLLRDRLVRPAMVIVSKVKKEEVKEEVTETSEEKGE